MNAKTSKQDKLDKAEAQRRVKEMGGSLQSHLDDIASEREQSGVSFMITVEQKIELNRLGHNHAAIRMMTPEEAHRLLQEAKTIDDAGPNGHDAGNGHDPNAGKSTEETQAAMLKAALYYASKGIMVFPSPPGEKKSYKAERFSDTKWGKTNDPAVIKRDWNRWPEANVCITMGPDGYWVMELDTPAGHNVDGFASLRALEEKYSPLPETRQAISPSGSLHYYWKWPKGLTGTISNSTSKIGKGIDVRGDGGMVVAPPSLKPGKGAYSWHKDIPAVEAPEWLIALVVDATAKAERITGANPQAEPAKVAFAMALIPNDVRNWDKWNYWGMAIWHATGGNDIGCAAFHTWSMKLEGVYDVAATQERWDAYSKYPPTSVGAGTIFREADGIAPGWRDRYEDSKPKGFTLVCAKDIIIRPKQWLWPGHLLRGALELMSGIPGLGKSQTQIHLIACITAGLAFPDSTKGISPANVIMLTAEDTLDQEVIPRLLAARAVLERVQILKCIRKDGKDRQFLLGEDLDIIERVVAQVGEVALIAIDPITAYMGSRIDSHKTTDVRNQLGPLKDLAEKVDVATSAITHPAKNPSQQAIDQFIGSQAFVAAARIAHICIREFTGEGDDKKETGRILFSNAKNNPHTVMPTLAYRITEATVGQDETTRTSITAPHVVWDGAVDITANQAVQQAASAAGGGKKNNEQKAAQAFLKEILDGKGPVLVKAINAESDKHGFTRDQLRTAREKIDRIAVVQTKEGWTWEWLF